MQEFKNFCKTLILAAVLGLGVSYIYAWTEPTLNPPDGNVAAPINVSSNEQTILASKILEVTGVDGPRTGILTIGGGLNVEGVISSVGDVCTDAGGGKCLSTVEGSSGSGTGFTCKGSCPDLVTAE